MFKFKQKITGQTINNGTKNVDIMVLLKYLNNFWGALEMPLISYKINHILTWSVNCFIVANPINNKDPAFAIVDAKLYVPVLTLSTQDNAELLQQLKSGFKRRINWDKYQWRVTIQVENTYLNYSSFQGVNRLFVYLLIMIIIKQVTNDIFLHM